MLPIFRILKTELTEQNKISRQTEPVAIMAGEQQTLEYNKGAELDGPLLPIYLFHLPRIASLLKAGDHVLELGCGTAHILCMLANLCPEVQFIGLDMSLQMLDHARANQKKIENKNGKILKNLTFIEGSMTDLSKLTLKYDAVISNMAFHHLPSLEDVKKVFREIQNVTKPNAAIYISDFVRPKSLKTIELLSTYSYKNGHSILNDDYKYSLMASFSEIEMREALAMMDKINVQFSKVKVFGFLFFITTKPIQKVPVAVAEFVKKTLDLMPAKNQRDYWALRIFSMNS